MVRISASVRDASASMTFEGGDGGVRVGGGDRPTGLGLDGDGGHVVGDGVVQLPGELLALAELDLFDLADPDTRRGTAPSRRAPPGSSRMASAGHRLDDADGLVGPDGDVAAER